MPVTAFTLVKKPKTPKKSAKTGKISGGVAVASTPFVAGPSSMQPMIVPSPAGREPSAPAGQLGLDASGANILVEPASPSPGQGSGGDSSGNWLSDVANGGAIPGLGLNIDQVTSIYDRVKQRTDSPTPIAPGASTGRENRPESVPSPAQTPKPSGPSSAVKIGVAALVGALLGFLVGRLVGAVLGAVLFAVLAKFFI